MKPAIKRTDSVDTADNRYVTDKILTPLLWDGLIRLNDDNKYSYVQRRRTRANPLDLCVKLILRTLSVAPQDSILLERVCGRSPQFIRALDILLGGSHNHLPIKVEYRQGMYWLLPEALPAHSAEYLESIAKMDKWDLMEVA